MAEVHRALQQFIGYNIAEGNTFKQYSLLYIMFALPIRELNATVFSTILHEKTKTFLFFNIQENHCNSNAFMFDIASV